MRPTGLEDLDIALDRVFGLAAPWDEDPQTVCVSLVMSPASWSLPFVCPFSHRDPTLLCPCSASLHPLLSNSTNPFAQNLIPAHGLARFTLDHLDNHCIIYCNTRTIHHLDQAWISRHRSNRDTTVDASVRQDNRPTEACMSSSSF